MRLGGRVVPPLIGVAGVVAIGAGAILSEPREWYDAYVEVWVSGLHTLFAVHDARVVASAGPYVAAALVCLAGVAARRRGATWTELVRLLGALTIALLWIELVKLTVDRARPFNLGPTQHDSFPSGDTAFAALCAATAFHLIGLRPIARDWLRTAVAVTGAAAAVTIGLSRLYLDRHWLSDVATSLLIGVVFWSAAPVWPASLRKLAVVLVGIAASMLAGPRIVVSSPTAPEGQRQFELTAESGSRRDGGASAWRFRSAPARYSLVRVELVPLRDDPDAEALLELDLDGDRIAMVPLAADRRVYALPLPRLTSGLHEVCLRTRWGYDRPHGSSPAVARISIQGAAGAALAGDGSDDDRYARNRGPRDQSERAAIRLPSR